MCILVLCSQADHRGFKVAYVESCSALRYPVGDRRCGFLVVAGSIWLSAWYPFVGHTFACAVGPNGLSPRGIAPLRRDHYFNVATTSQRVHKAANHFSHTEHIVAWRNAGTDPGGELSCRNRISGYFSRISQSLQDSLHI
jgi:hypothetical protein